MRLLKAILVLLVAISCGDHNPSKWFYGAWYLPETSSKVVITRDSIIGYNDQEYRFAFKCNDCESKVVISVQESENAYEHQVEIKLDSISSKRDTIWFTESDFNTSSFICRAKTK